MIGKGETYQNVKGLWEGGWETFWICAHCHASVKILDRLNDDFCFCLYQLWESAKECFAWWKGGAGPKAALVLIVSAKRKWTYRRGPRKGELMDVPTSRIKEEVLTA